MKLCTLLLLLLLAACGLSNCGGVSNDEQPDPKYPKPTYHLEK